MAAPASASAMAVARPMPEPAPVISATFPANGRESVDGTLFPFLPYDFALAGDVVNEDVLAQAIWSREERTPAIDARHLVHEVDQVVSAFEHEGVDHDLITRAASHLFQRHGDRPIARRIGEDRARPFE